MEDGPPHVQYNSMTERLDYLYIRREHNVIFERCWEAYTEGCDQKADEAPKADPGKPELEDNGKPELEEATPQATGKAMAKGKANSRKRRAAEEDDNNAGGQDQGNGGGRGTPPQPKQRPEQGVVGSQAAGLQH